MFGDIQRAALIARQVLAHAGFHQHVLGVSSGPTRSRAAIGWTPLTRDGGQQLGRKFQLYDMTSDKNINLS